jgi:CelD/BcsL family acetyltransferase involved in cellulose biosynthesis
VLVTLGYRDPAWLAFVQAQPHSLVFHHPAWLECLQSSYGHRLRVLALTDAAGTITAGLPLATVQSVITGRRLVALPYSDHCRPLTRDPAALEPFAEALGDWWRTHGQPPLEVRGELPGGFATQPAAVIHELALDRPPAALLAGCSKMHQRNVRKAQQAGLVVDQVTSAAGLRHFYRLHTLTRRRLGVPTQPWRFFEAIRRHVLAPGLGFVLVAYHGGRPCAGAIFLAWKDTLVYKYGASDPAYWAYRPNHLIFWTAIQWAAARGFRRLDFGRSDFDGQGLRAFKAQWGATERPLLYAHLGSEALARTQTRGRLGSALRRAIQCSPPALGRLVGELLYGHFA